MRITVLGAGSAYGTPMIFNHWRDANPNDVKNIRTRASIVLAENGAAVLVDAGPDVRFQINACAIADIQAVFLTHGHYDHIGGVPELPRAAKLLGHKIDIYASAETLAELKTCYGYLFRGEEPEGCGLVWHEMPYNGEISIANLPFKLFSVPHHHLHSSAFRCENFAYITDWEGFDDKAAEAIKGASCLYAECNNAMQPEKNGHSSWPEIEQRLTGLGIKKIVLGHLSARVDYETFRQALPNNVIPAYDGLVFEVD